MSVVTTSDPPHRAPGDVVRSEAEALSAVRRHVGLLIVDLDETLYLRNSTEDFIDTAVPGPMALLVLTVLAIVRPWRWTGGVQTRDAWRVGFILALFPWTLGRWRKRVRATAPELLNAPLADALRDRGRPFTIATLGFGPVVRPLVDDLGFPEAELIACRPFAPVDRARGKLELVRDRLGSPAVAEAMVLTDSGDDAPLLAACAEPVLATWSRARWIPALRATYLPGTYLTFFKRPGTSPLRPLLVDDFPIWWLAALPVAATPFGTLGLFLLFVSFWCIYEAGYIENDAVAARYESDGKLSETFRDFRPESVGPRPWFYALATGAGAMACGHDNLWTHDATRLGIWLAVLAALRLYYHAYNVSEKDTRAWLYVGLQVFRSAAFVAVVPINEAGLYACAAYVVARSYSYMLYRHLRSFAVKDWPHLRERLLRLVFLLAFLLIGLAAYGGRGEAPLPSWWFHAGLLASWFAVLARHDLRSLYRAAYRIDRVK